MESGLSLKIIFLKDKWWLELNQPDLAPHRWFRTDRRGLNPKRLSLPPLSQGRLLSIHQRGVALMCGSKQCQIKHFTNMWLALVCYWYFGLLRTMRIQPTLKISIWIAYLMSPPLSRNLDSCDFRLCKWCYWPCPIQMSSMTRNVKYAYFDRTS